MYKCKKHGQPCSFSFYRSKRALTHTHSLTQTYKKNYYLDVNLYKFLYLNKACFADKQISSTL